MIYTGFSGSRASTKRSAANQWPTGVKTLHGGIVCVRERVSPAGGGRHPADKPREKTTLSGPRSERGLERLRRQGKTGLTIRRELFVSRRTSCLTFAAARRFFWERALFAAAPWEKQAGSRHARISSPCGFSSRCAFSGETSTCEVSRKDPRSISVGSINRTFFRLFAIFTELIPRR